MAIVDLGTLNLVVGGGPVAYAAFPYDATTAIGVGAIFSSPNFGSIFSYVEIRVGILSGSLPLFLNAEPIRLDVSSVIQVMFVPFSPLYFGNGNCILTAERIPFWRGAGDGTPLTLNLLYDDALTVPTWRG